MDAPSYLPGDEPQDAADAILSLRANLRSVTDTLDGILERGFPKRGRSRDDHDAHALWWEDRWRQVARAKHALEVTAAFCGGSSVSRSERTGLVPLLRRRIREHGGDALLEEAVERLATLSARRKREPRDARKNFGGR